jgi:hypothetical protein
VADVSIHGDNVAVGDGVLEFAVVIATVNEAIIPAGTMILTVPEGFELAEGSNEIATPPLSGMEAFTQVVRLRKTGPQVASFLGTFVVDADWISRYEEFTIGWAPEAKQMEQELGAEGVAFADVPSGGSILVMPQEVNAAEHAAPANTFSIPSSQPRQEVTGMSVTFLPIITTPPESLILTATMTDTPEGPPDANLDNVFQKVILTARRSSFPEGDLDGNYVKSRGILLTFDVAMLIDHGYHPDSLTVWTRPLQSLPDAHKRWLPLDLKTYDPATRTVQAWAYSYGEFVLGRGLR